MATTRPETIAADVALAVNANDTRHSMLIGRMARNPLTGERLPIVGDDYVDVEKGTGVLKVG